MRILRLTLKGAPFQVMITREKPEEYRKPTEWMLSRLIDKYGNKREYDLIHFTNGYGSTRPYFVCKYESWVTSNRLMHKKYSNGLEVTVEPEDIILYLGPITEKGNL